MATETDCKVAKNKRGGLTISQVRYRIKTMKAKVLTFTDQLRQIVENSGMSRYQLSKKTRIDESTLSRFVHGERCLSEKNLDKLGEYLRLRIVADKPLKKGK
jgi:ribosome-binding protein aMBF1 (putative translation factor)